MKKREEKNILLGGTQQKIYEHEMGSKERKRVVGKTCVTDNRWFQQQKVSLESKRMGIF